MKTKVHPGPWRWRRFRPTADSPMQCVLESTAKPSECPAGDTVVVYMREDFAAFPYAGSLPSHRLVETAPEVLEVLEELVTRFDIIRLRGYVGSALFDKAHAVINKARGTPFASIPNIVTSIRHSVEKGEMSMDQAVDELYEANLIPYRNIEQARLKLYDDAQEAAS